MADTLYFSRDTKVYLAMGSDIWEIPVLDGFSFSQATNASEVTLNEMADSAGKSRRSRQLFTDSYAPAEWSFSTYVRPFTSVAAATGGWEDTGSDAHMHAVEESLWANFAAAPTFTASSGATEAAWSAGVTNSTSNMIVDFAGSEKTTLGTFDLFFVLGKGRTNPTIYKIQGCVVNEASIDFDIDGIATINWSGFGSIITDHAAEPTATITEAISSTSNFIRNRLTTLGVSAVQDPDGDGANEFESSYDLVLTGGNITLTNNITFLTPETLGTVNQPVGHVTGTRSVSGNFTCYLDGDTASNGSATLFEDIIEATDVITNDFTLSFFIGGETGNNALNAPGMQIQLPTCHLEVPTHSIDDVISIETNFHALPASISPTAADDFEAKITYKGTTY